MLQQFRGLKTRKVVVDIECRADDKETTPVAADSELAEPELSFTSQSHASDDFLVITVHEARNLVAKDHDTHSSDPFAKATLGALSKKTRVIYRNCHPLWEQQLVFPIGGMAEAEPLLVELFDRDFRAKEFLGQIVMTLGKALEIAADAVLSQRYWFSISKQRSTDIVGGELCLGFQVIDAARYASLNEELNSQLDADRIAASLAGKSLHVQLKGLNGLRASGLLGISTDTNEAVPTGLSLFIKYGRLMIKKPLPPLPPEPESGRASDSSTGSGQEVELPVNEEVVIALEEALRAAPLAARRRDELYDIKLYLKSSDTNTTIAKTQIPIWAIPSDHKPNIVAATPSTAGGPAAPTAAVTAVDATNTRSSTPDTPRVTQDNGHPGWSEAIASKLPQSLQYRRVSTSGDSAPSTPRGTRTSCTGDFTLAAYRGAAPQTQMPRSVIQQSSSSDDLTQRSKSDTAGVLASNSPRNLSQLSAMSGGSHSSIAKGAFIEGSLGSVTYGKIQPPAAPAAFGKKRVQNLGELNSRAAFKTMLAPPKEASRAGWVPTKAQNDDSDGAQGADGGSKHYCRIMEGYVPMYSNLEIGLALQLVSQVQPSAGDGPATTQEGDVTVDYSDDEDSRDATPITPLEPYDLVLQDLTVPVGVNKLHNLLVGSKSALIASHWAAEGLLDLQVGLWQLAPAGAVYLRSRQVSYIKKLNIPLPLAPKQCQVWEDHRLLVKQDGGFVVQHICTNNAPKGDCFRALIQICGVYLTSNSSRLRISMKLDWHKNTLGKGMVQSSAEADSKRGWGNLVEALQQHISSSRGISGGGAKVSEAACAAAMGKPSATTNYPGSATSQSDGWDNMRITVVIGAGLMFVLLLMLVLGMWGVVSELRQFNHIFKLMLDAAPKGSILRPCREL